MKFQVNKPQQLTFQNELKSVCLTKAKSCGPIDHCWSYSIIIYGSLCLEQASQVALAPVCHCRRPKRHWFDPWVGKISWRRKWHPTPVFLLGESHGQKSLVGYSPKGRKELDTTEVTQHACTHVCTSSVQQNFLCCWQCSRSSQSNIAVTNRALVIECLNCGSLRTEPFISLNFNLNANSHIWLMVPYWTVQI